MFALLGLELTGGLGLILGAPVGFWFHAPTGAAVVLEYIGFIFAFNGFGGGPKAGLVPYCTDPVGCGCPGVLGELLAATEVFGAIFAPKVFAVVVPGLWPD